MKMPICPPPTEREGGFTLIELLVVMVIVGMMAAIVAANFGREPSGLGRQRALQQLKVAVAAAQETARHSGSMTSVSPSALMEGAAVEKAAFPAASGTIALYPDGSSSGGVVTLTGRPLAEVDWLTGEVRDAG